MKGLWKYISPFAPDQSGAAAVLYGLGGIVVICDAGGCAGNICGFDEPRWFSGRKSAVFSAGLRDMDAIMGRDDRLVAKICRAAAHIQASFIAIVGTPVPSVIGTDYQALERMLAKKIEVPILSLQTTGMSLYDRGMEAAYSALDKMFGAKTAAVDAHTVGVLGAVPLELMHPRDGLAIYRQLVREGWQRVLLFDHLEDYEQAGRAKLNIVVSPTGLLWAEALKKRLGTPYICRYFGYEAITAHQNMFFQKNVLIIHQQVAANALATELLRAGAASVHTASWFMSPSQWARPGHTVLREEDDFRTLVADGDFDCIIGDVYFKRAIPEFLGTYIDYPHFAVSGRG